MPNHSNKLQKWISKSEQERIETLIARIEKQYPFEIVVAFTDAPAVVPFAAARMVALLALVAELIAEALWLPVPAWAFGLLVLMFLFIPLGQLKRLWLFRCLARKSEREIAVRQQAELCFNDLGLARTRERNALLLFFNVRERVFCLNPDRTLSREWPELKIEDLVNELRQNLEKSKAPETAAAEAVQRLLVLAQTRWPNATEKQQPTDELPNALSWWSAR